ncbi:hypothetical protein LCGC14_0721440 [marine sediment metagenome]|uniref:Uncharacterized protein n=1 Tax=marine sediment metagenome TaxID=412755 RepID=A0A0F9SXK5_9ZZZZ
MGTTPAILTIMDEVEARLGNISASNGYWFDPKKISRARLKAWEGYDLPAINYWGTNVENDRAAYANDERGFSLFTEMHSQTRDDPFIDIAEKMASDVITAMVRLPAATAGSSVGQDGSRTDMSGESDTKFKISADGDAVEEVTCDWSSATTGALTAAQMQTQIRALGSNKATVTVVFQRGRYVITSSTTGASSAIVITAGSTLDCSDQLRIGLANSGSESTGLASAPTVAADPNYDLNSTVKDLVYAGHDYIIGEGQQPWCGVLVRWTINYYADPFNMFTYRED